MHGYLFRHLGGRWCRLNLPGFQAILYNGGRRNHRTRDEEQHHKGDVNGVAGRVVRQWVVGSTRFRCLGRFRPILWHRRTAGGQIRMLRCLDRPETIPSFSGEDHVAVIQHIQRGFAEGTTCCVGVPARIKSCIPLGLKRGITN